MKSTTLIVKNLSNIKLEDKEREANLIVFLESACKFQSGVQVDSLELGEKENTLLLTSRNPKCSAKDLFDLEDYISELLSLIGER